MKMNYWQRLAGSQHFLLLALIVFFMFLFFILVPGCKKTESLPGENIISGQSANKLKDVDLQLTADGFVSPLGVIPSPDQTNRLFVIDQVGKIWIIDGSGNKLATPFLDVSSMMVVLRPGYDERGLLGFAFHPNYTSNGKFYVYYTAPPRAGGPTPTTTWDHLGRVAEFRVSSNPNLADMSSERAVLEWDHPQFNHNGGTLAFGPDGYLYISIGDGGGANDVGPGHVEDWYVFNAGGNAQDLEANLLGNVLRIDVNAMPYGIPADNPFVGKPGRDEIWAFGLRNPYRFSFDMSGSRQLILGDAGQLRYEEIDVIKKGFNYGWNVKEGFECFDAANPLAELEDCPDKDNLGNMLIDPVIQINNWQNLEGGRATTVIGGNVYRGHAIPGFHGKYIFGTFSQTPTQANGELFIATPAGMNPWNFDEINLASHPGDIGYYLKGFGQDLSGEVYLTVSSILGPSGTSGRVMKLVPAGN
jgi:glucose/arabinose dehydrogenase